MVYYGNIIDRAEKKVNLVGLIKKFWKTEKIDQVTEPNGQNM